MKLDQANVSTRAHSAEILHLMLQIVELKGLKQLDCLGLKHGPKGGPLPVNWKRQTDLG